MCTFAFQKTHPSCWKIEYHPVAEVGIMLVLLQNHLRTKATCKVSRDAYRTKSSNHQRFKVAIAPLSLKSLSDIRSDDELGRSTVLNIDPQNGRDAASVTRDHSGRHIAEIHFAGVTALGFPKVSFNSGPSERAAEAKTAAAADDPVEIESACPVSPVRRYSRQ